MKRRILKPFIFIVILILVSNAGFLETLFDGSEEVEYDTQMRTEEYHVDIQVTEDGSYLVEEQIQTVFLSPRHGIYRYIPQKGSSVWSSSGGKIEKMPYYAKVEFLSSNEIAEVTEESGNTVIRLGSEHGWKNGLVNYTLQYQVTPYFQDETYSNAYYNIFPNRWQNEIPAGSSFTITFPKEFDREKLKFYWGEYGSAADGTDSIQTSWNGLTLTGTLTQTLQAGEGLTFFAEMDAGYFSEIHKIGAVDIGLAVFTAVILGIIILLFVFFGKDPAMYPSIQFQPPEDLDSAAVGYIIDGAVEDRDVLSLLIFWADKGYLRIQEKKNNNMLLIREKDLLSNVPAYERMMFDRLFREGDEVTVNSLKYKFTDTIGAVKEQVKKMYSRSGKGEVYTASSRVARVISSFMSVLPFGAFVGVISILSPVTFFRGVLHVLSVVGLLAGIFVFNYAIDNWYSRKRSDRNSLVAAGLGVSLLSVAVFGGSYVVRAVEGEVFSFLAVFAFVVIATAIMIFLTGFMKKRTEKCTEWMGRLFGLRDFIETAELERLRVLAEENPQWFYHVLPYAYVFGLSDVFAKKLEGLAIPAPDWYEPVNHGSDIWDFYVFHHIFMRNMNYATRTMTQAEPPKVESAGSGGFGNGNFGGGNFGGGGFSGGGFGGGGGGSW